MPSKRKKSAVANGAGGVTIPPELLDQVVKGPMTGEEVQAVCLSLKKAIIERAMGAELSHHLGYRPGESRPPGQDNHRNGTTGKTVLTDDGPVRIEVPRDRDGSYAPLLIPKHERRFTGFDDKIIAMYARGMTVREIQGFLAEQYGTAVSPDFISSVTDEVMAEVTAWQAGTRRCTWRSGSCRTARATCWGCGSSRPRGRSSGSRCSTSSRHAGSRTS